MVRVKLVLGKVMSLSIKEVPEMNVAAVFVAEDVWPSCNRRFWSYQTCDSFCVLKIGPAVEVPTTAVGKKV
jgi:hypothetical protein